MKQTIIYQVVAIESGKRTVIATTQGRPHKADEIAIDHNERTGQATEVINTKNGRVGFNCTPFLKR